nr:immunoglobulin light chain junction region [Macaca mulatta]MOX73699.1 immunoglobulin light chain junction region [Macaca mulatta]MOX74103.1 immunoglobulin light chain junction region [Macaca mulatta]MOX75177.1 immunoglobulin light chain junction region [Macaca mulatta]MOX75239.1 immunoglobulin light chain junction region [Macaca mulatta]
DYYCQSNDISLSVLF